MSLLEATSRSQWERRARQLAWFTIIYNVAEGVAAVSTGIVVGSVALVGFGIDSSIEVFAAVVVLWRMQGVCRFVSGDLHWCRQLSRCAQAAGRLR